MQFFLKNGPAGLGAFLQGFAACVALIFTICNSNEISTNIQNLVYGVKDAKQQANAIADNVENLKKNTEVINDTLERTEKINSRIQTSLVQLCKMLLKTALVESPKNFGSTSEMWTYFGTSGLLKSLSDETFAALKGDTKPSNLAQQMQSLNQYFAEKKKTLVKFRRLLRLNFDKQNYPS